MNLIIPKLGGFCISLSGHDKGRIYVVIKIIDPEFVFVADGKCRGTKNPKKKRVKHLKFTGNSVNAEQTAKLAEGSLKDNELHKVILAEQKTGGQC